MRTRVFGKEAVSPEDSQLPNIIANRDTFCAFFGLCAVNSTAVIAGSIRNSHTLEELQTAAKGFAKTVIDRNGPVEVMTSRVPNDQKVEMDDIVLNRCASKPGNYFAVSGAEIQTALDANAVPNSQLRLME